MATQPQPPNLDRSYRGRLAPSPTGYLHLGHARTFWIAQQRARLHHGLLLFRNEDLDRARSKPEFVQAMFEDLRWFGLEWQEGPDLGGALGPYSQSQRGPFYLQAFQSLLQHGLVYPCRCSRRDVLHALGAPHPDEAEPVYPGTCRPSPNTVSPRPTPAAPALLQPKASWRFRVPDGQEICFVDGCHGPQRFVAGQDFGDFVVWRHDNLPAYQLAVVADDAAMQITEVVRGADLLLSTARQLLLYRALGFQAPSFYHCPLMTDQAGIRLAKRHDSLSLRALRARGLSPQDLRRGW